MFCFVLFVVCCFLMPQREQVSLSCSIFFISQYNICRKTNNEVRHVSLWPEDTALCNNVYHDNQWPMLSKYWFNVCVNVRQRTQKDRTLNGIKDVTMEGITWLKESILPYWFFSTAFLVYTHQHEALCQSLCLNHFYSPSEIPLSYCFLSYYTSFPSLTSEG